MLHLVLFSVFHFYSYSVHVGENERHRKQSNGSSSVEKYKIWYDNSLVGLNNSKINDQWTWWRSNKNHPNLLLERRNTLRDKNSTSVKYGTIKQNNINVIRDPRREEQRTISRNNGQRYSKSDKTIDINLQSQEVPSSSSKIHMKTTKSDIITKLLKTSDKKKNLKSSHGKRSFTYRRRKIEIIADVYLKEIASKQTTSFFKIFFFDVDHF